MTTRDLLVEWVQDSFEQTSDLEAAIKDTTERAERDGLLVDLWREHGESIVRDAWRTWARMTRKKAQRTQRVVSLQPLNEPDSLYESLYCVAGQWRRLGDLTDHEVELIAADYGERESAERHMRTVFEAIRRRMKKGQRVRDRWSEEELRKLFAKED